MLTKLLFYYGHGDLYLGGNSFAQVKTKMLDVLRSHHASQLKLLAQGCRSVDAWRCVLVDVNVYSTDTYIFLIQREYRSKLVSRAIERGVRLLSAYNASQP
jgi:hypothetical protein